MTGVTVDIGLPYIFVPIILLQHGYCTFVIILFGPFTWLFINLTMCNTSSFPQICNHSWSCRTSILDGCHFTQNEFVQVPFKVILAGASETFYHWDFFPLGLRVLDDFRSFRCMKEFGDGFDCVIFPRLLISWRKLQLSPLEHCHVELPLPTISKNSLFTLYCP